MKSFFFFSHPLVYNRTGLPEIKYKADGSFLEILVTGSVSPADMHARIMLGVVCAQANSRPLSVSLPSSFQSTARMHTNPTAGVCSGGMNGESITFWEE